MKKLLYIKPHTVRVRAETANGDKPDGMSLSLSRRKAGQGNGYREVKDFHKFVPLDNIAPPKAEDYDPNEISEYQQEINHQRSVDGDGTPLNNDERV